MFSKLSPATLHETRGPDVVAAAVVAMVVSTMAVVLRFVSRARNGDRFVMFRASKFWWDDWAVLITTIFSHGFLALNIAWTKYGLGHHFLAVPKANATTNNNISHAAILMYAICLWLIKISALLLYARIFMYSPTFIRILWGVGSLVTAWFIVSAIVPWFNCYPISKTLNLFEQGVCYNRMTWFYFSVFFNAFLDLVILILPLPIIIRLQMTPSRKLAVILVFLIGYSSAFLSFARFILIVRDPTLMSTVPSADSTWRLIPLLILSMYETPLAILALCLPLVRELFAHVLQNHNLSFQKLFSTRRSGKSTANSGSDHTVDESKPRTGTSRSSTTAVESRVDSEDDYHSYAVAVDGISMDSIARGHEAEVKTHDAERGFA